MPTYWTPHRNGSHGLILKYHLDYHLIGHPEYVERLLELRKRYIKWRDEMLRFQIDCAKEKDYTLAKFFSHEAAYWLKSYRTTCLLLGQLAYEPPGDCAWHECWDLPPELFPHLQHIELVCQMTEEELKEATAKTERVAHLKLATDSDIKDHDWLSEYPEGTIFLCKGFSDMVLDEYEIIQWSASRKSVSLESHYGFRDDNVRQWINPKEFSKKNRLHEVIVSVD